MGKGAALSATYTDGKPDATGEGAAAYKRALQDTGKAMYYDETLLSAHTLKAQTLQGEARPVPGVGGHLGAPHLSCATPELRQSAQLRPCCRAAKHTHTHACTAADLCPAKIYTQA